MKSIHVHVTASYSYATRHWWKVAQEKCIKKLSFNTRLVYMNGSLMVLFRTLSWEVLCAFASWKVTPRGSYTSRGYVMSFELPCIEKTFPQRNSAWVIHKIRGATRAYARKNEITIESYCMTCLINQLAFLVQSIDTFPLRVSTSL